MCEDCRDKQGVKDWQIRAGTTFKERPQQKDQGCVVKAVEPGLDDLEYWSAIVMGDGRHIECPECGESREVEPDATYTYLCGCGVTVKVPEPAI
jgi:hypothetical protein